MKFETMTNVAQQYSGINLEENEALLEEEKGGQQEEEDNFPPANNYIL